MVKVYGRMAGGMTCLAGALLGLAVLAAPAGADGGSSPCGDQMRDCIYWRTGSCSPESCMPNPSLCQGCTSGTFDCYSSCTGTCKGLKAQPCTHPAVNNCNVSGTDPAGCSNCDCTGYYSNPDLAYKCWCKRINTP